MVIIHPHFSHPKSTCLYLEECYISLVLSTLCYILTTIGFTFFLHNYIRRRSNHEYPSYKTMIQNKWNASVFLYPYYASPYLYFANVYRHRVLCDSFPLGSSPSPWRWIWCFFKFSSCVSNSISSTTSQFINVVKKFFT